jgi:hypothetical protein
MKALLTFWNQVLHGKGPCMQKSAAAACSRLAQLHLPLPTALPPACLLHSRGPGSPWQLPLAPMPRRSQGTYKSLSAS